MARRATVLLAALWVLSPGCWSPGEFKHQPPTPWQGTPQTITPPHGGFGPGFHVPPSATWPSNPCARVEMQLSTTSFAVGQNFTAHVLLTNCGADAWPRPESTCAGQAPLAPGIEGPVRGWMANGTLGNAFGSCGVFLLQAATYLLPNETMETVVRWNGTIVRGCGDGHGWAIPCPSGSPSAPAPSGNYTVTASFGTPDGSRAWSTNATVLLQGWTEPHAGGWNEFHPQWEAGPRNLTLGNRTVAVPADAFGATDGSTYLYVGRDLAEPGFDPDACAPGTSGTFVRLSVHPCRLALYPSVVEG